MFHHAMAGVLGLTLSFLSQSAPPAAVPVAPSDYRIGPDDVIAVVFWREPDISGEVTVRPDGKITLPLVGEIQAAGLDPKTLEKEILSRANSYLTEPNVAVVIRTINSRKVFVTGSVGSPGAYPITGPLTVLQAIALAGGLTEFADQKNITVLRTEGAKTVTFKFNYKDVSRGKKLEQNILLRPGDTVVVVP